MYRTAAALERFGLRAAEPIRFRRNDRGRYVVGRVEGVEIDGSITLRDPDGSARSLRPERVEMSMERLQEGAHTLKAEVLEFIYMGDIFRTRLRVAGTDDFVIKTRNAPDQRRLKPGEMIEIGWLPEDCRALDA